MNNEKQRVKDWYEITEEYDKFFYADDGIFIASLMDNELDLYYWDFDRIKDLIQKLKDFESKYGTLSDSEKEYLIDKKETLLSLKTRKNRVGEYYSKMNTMYDFIEDY